VAALVADRYGRRATMILASIVLILFGLSFGALFVTGQVAVVALFLILGQCTIGLTYGPLGTLLSELFPAEVRYTGASLTFNLAGILGASLAPYVAMSLATQYGVQYVGYYLSGAALVSLVALVLTGSQRQVKVVAQV